MNSVDFVKFYQKQDSDELVIPFKDEVGFTVIKKYELGSKYFNEEKLMFIRLYLTEGTVLNGGVEMVDSNKVNEKNDSYKITDISKYCGNITNFRFGFEENFIFDLKKGLIFHKKSKKQFTLNKFIDILVYNHLSDRLFLKRNLNKIINLFLKFLFWLSDKHYSGVSIMLETYYPKQRNEHDKIDDKNIDPFFKYFCISKNLLFSLFLISFFSSLLISKIFCSIDFSLSNPSLVLFFFLILFVFEKLSVWLDASIKLFFKKEKNIIYKLYNYPFTNSFKLKLPK